MGLFRMLITLIKLHHIFQGVAHSIILLFPQISSLFRVLLTLIIIFQGIVHSCSSPPSSGRCLSWPSYSKYPPGSFCCLECCSSYGLFCQPLLKRGQCQNRLKNMCKKSNKLA